MYILPGYTKSFEENNILYISSDLYQNKVEIDKKDIIKEFYSLVEKGGCESLSTSLEKFLHEQGLIQNESEIKESLKEVKKLLSESLILTIMPTEACNFRCTYCYESHKHTNMTEEMLAHIRNYIAKQVYTSKNIVISWFGGEPTLCKNTILKLSHFVQKLQEKHMFKYNANMTTNGYILDCESFKEYYKAGINEYQITIDGWNHDLTRPHISGKGTLKTILGNLRDISLLPKNYDFNIIIRYNILDEEPDFSWYDFLYKQFGEDKRFTVKVATVNDWGGEEVQNLNILKGDRKVEVSKLHNDYLNKIGLSNNKKVKPPLSDICYASCDYGIIFRANRKIEKCTIALDHHKNQVGIIDLKKGVLLDKGACELWCNAELKDECLVCLNVLHCLNIACRKGIVVDGYSEDISICKMFTDKIETTN